LISEKVLVARAPRKAAFGAGTPATRLTKTAFDVFVAALLLAIVSIPLLIIVLIIRLDGGPALYAHKRIGAGGRPFNCLKFRTMVPDSERVLAEVLAKDSAMAAQWTTTRKLTNDPRVTRVGRFLRNSSLDELPQLINVLRLEMSLVGPRPIVESEIPLYGEGFTQYCAVRPGMTGLWQVSGRSDISYERRVQLDTWYVDNWSFGHDMIVLLRTIPAVLGGEGAR
jgi:undecaprenyl-phosphate galactose phosphotransferase